MALSVAMARPQRRWVLEGMVLAIAAVALLPLLALAAFAWLSPSGRGALGEGGGVALANSVTLVVAVGLGGAALGTANGWLTACCRFPGRRWLRIAQLLPLATPAYLLAAVLIDLGSRFGWRVHGLGWAVLVLTLSTYSYVFLLATESFASGGRRQLEASRSLGVGPWGGFRRVALPLAFPAVGAGVALLGVPSLSSAILRRWQDDGEPQAAVGLALVALALVSVLVAGERWLRGRSRRWNPGAAMESGPQWPLRGWRRLLAWCMTGVPPLLALGVPLLWAALSVDQLRGESAAEMGALVMRSLGLALAAAGLTVGAGMLLAVAHRWIPQVLLRRVTFVAGMGYAVPGAVLALALLLVGGPLGIGPLALLVWGYADRFLAVAKQDLDAAFERLPPSLDEAAAGLGCGWWAVLRRVHLPLLRGPLLVGALLVFVDVVKELPLTFALRPFDFDTLSVRVYQYASDERVGAALVPALLILLLGLAAALALVPGLERRVGRG
jgi:iron(III) transport system permease protein